MMKKTIIFIHIPKTAGTTLARIFKENYFLWPKEQVYMASSVTKEQRLLEMSPEQRKKIRIVHGHISFGIHELLPQPCQYVTYLRDPVKRVVSYYNHILNDPQHYLYEQVTKAGLGLGEFLKSGLTTELDNLQVRMLAGDEKDAAFGEVNEGDLERAKQNIEKWFPVVGVADYFDESVLLLRDRLWKFFPFYVRAMTGVRPQLPEERILDLIREQNRFDMMLYEWSTKRLMQQIEDAGPGFAKRVQRFQRMNHLFQTVMSLLPVYKR